MFKKGDLVFIPKGTPIKRVYKPSAPAKRDMKVKIHDFYPWEGGQVLWAGSGGYWAYAPASQVRLIPQHHGPFAKDEKKHTVCLECGNCVTCCLPDRKCHETPTLKVPIQ